MLRKYTALPEQCLSILGPRRVPPLKCPAQNTHSSLAISTSVGFASLQVRDYDSATNILYPDATLTAVDLVQEDKISVKRTEKSADRTHAWLRDTLAGIEDDNPEAARPAVFASIPPIEKEQQSFFLSDLSNDYSSKLSGICLYSPTSIDVIPNNLQGLPRMCLMNPASPHDILKAIMYGVDLVSTPFVSKTSEHGIAFDFTFPIIPRGAPQPLGRDMWSSNYATSITPLSPSCECYTCTQHHRAYVHHLLQAREMLAWTLLQIHNFAALDRFFAAVRESIINGTFNHDKDCFNRAYEPEMPKQTGGGPRVRGYQTKSVGGGEPKKNPKAYGRLEDQLERTAEAKTDVAEPMAEMTTQETTQSNFAEKAQ
jgi:queuine tRNA-ribosyltransferase accessory subunit